TCTATHATGAATTGRTDAGTGAVTRRTRSGRRTRGSGRRARRGVVAGAIDAARTSVRIVGGTLQRGIAGGAAIVDGTDLLSHLLHVAAALLARLFHVDAAVATIAAQADIIIGQRRAGQHDAQRQATQDHWGSTHDCLLLGSKCPRWTGRRRWRAAHADGRSSADGRLTRTGDGKIPIKPLLL